MRKIQGIVPRVLVFGSGLETLPFVRTLMWEQASPYRPVGLCPGKDGMLIALVDQTDQRLNVHSLTRGLPTMLQQKFVCNHGNRVYYLSACAPTLVCVQVLAVVCVSSTETRQSTSSHSTPQHGEQKLLYQRMINVSIYLSVYLSISLSAVLRGKPLWLRGKHV